jgi:hypothetical protein
MEKRIHELDEILFHAKAKVEADSDCPDRHEMTKDDSP